MASSGVFLPEIISCISVPSTSTICCSSGTGGRCQLCDLALAGELVDRLDHGAASDHVGIVADAVARADAVAVLGVLGHHVLSSSAT